MTIQDILDRLNAEGFEKCFIDSCNPHQIIVTNRGEIELMYGEVMIYDRLANTPGYSYGNHQTHTTIDALFEDIYATWTKTELPGKPSLVVQAPPEKAETIMDRIVDFIKELPGCGGSCEQGRKPCDCQGVKQ